MSHTLEVVFSSFPDLHHHINQLTKIIRIQPYQPRHLQRYNNTTPTSVKVQVCATGGRSFSRRDNLTLERRTMRRSTTANERTESVGFHGTSEHIGSNHRRHRGTTEYFFVSRRPIGRSVRGSLFHHTHVLDEGTRSDEVQPSTDHFGCKRSRGDIASDV